MKDMEPSGQRVGDTECFRSEHLFALRQTCKPLVGYERQTLLSRRRTKECVEKKTRGMTATRELCERPHFDMAALMLIFRSLVFWRLF